jgi:signal transduction histidine kinase
MRRADVASLVSGIALIAFGAVLVLETSGAIRLTLASFAPMACGCVGIVAFAFGLALPARAQVRAWLTVSLGAALLLLALLLGLRTVGGLFPHALVWPLVLVVLGAALLLRQATGPEKVAERPEPPTPEARDRQESELVRKRAAVASRTGVGVALVIAAGLVFLQLTGALTAARDVVLTVLVAIVVLGLIFAPWVIRLVRSLTAERSERIRSQERAELAAHLHDSVLQTLALVQRNSDNPREVAALARGQERELRAWLSGRSQGPQGRLAGALVQTAGEVESAHGVPIEVVTVGDRELDAPAEALVGAAREAMVNASKFGRGRPVDVYAEAAAGRTEVFVRDRGPGFDLAAMPADRRGVRESILGRMERHGGRARFHTLDEGGTEVELVLETDSR